MVDLEHKQNAEDAVSKVKAILSGIDGVSSISMERELGTFVGLDFSFNQGDLESTAFVSFNPSFNDSTGHLGMRTHNRSNFPNYIVQAFVGEIKRLYPDSNLITEIEVQDGNSHLNWGNLYPQ